MTADYPYDDTAGYVQRTPGGGPDAPGKWWAMRASLEGAYMGDRVWRSRVAAEISLWRMTLRNETGFYLEQPLRDALYMGSTNLMMSLVMRPHGIWRLGGGLNYMIDGRTPTAVDPSGGRREYALGANGTTSFDLFPMKPLVISVQGDLGTLYAARTFAVRGTAGLQLNRFELFGGYEYRQVGKVPFNGPVAGLRIWF